MKSTMEGKPADLILVRHSMPEIDPARPARQWQLSDEGRWRCQELAKRLSPYMPQVIVSSEEPKAVETARIVATALGMEYQTATGLHEHERSGMGWSSQEEFVEAVAKLFAQPERLVMGNETADQAYARFASSVDDLISRYAGQSLMIVAHGTVMSLFVSRRCGVEPFPLWRQLGLPAYIRLRIPDYEVMEIVSIA